jgi:septal ring factor EnvC (AmiA/AmiB activator)
MREISQQLGKLKKKHDVVKKQVNAMENNLSKVKKEIDGLLV